MGKWIHKLSNIDRNNKKADCLNCGRVSVKPVKRSGGKTGFRCKVAFVKHNKNSSVGYGYTIGECEICLSYTEKLVQDHNHKNGKLRGRVCQKCNWLIGVVENGKLLGISSYLKRYSPKLS